MFISFLIKLKLGKFQEWKALQLNKYETAPNCIQLSQKLTLFCFDLEQFYEHIMQKLVKTGKNTEIKSSFGLIE